MPATLMFRPSRSVRHPALRLPRLLPALRQVAARVGRWRQAARERRQLAALSDRMLRDIGLTGAQARREAARPFWDVRS